MKTETFDEGQGAAFLSELRGTSRRSSKRAREARPELPRAAAVARTGLTSFLLKGWDYSFVAGRGYRLDAPDGRTTGWRESELLCCQQAKQLLKKSTS